MLQKFIIDQENHSIKVPFVEIRSLMKLFKSQNMLSLFHARINIISKFYLQEFYSLVNNFLHQENKVDIQQQDLEYVLIFLVPTIKQQ